MNRELDLKITKEIYGWDVYEDVPPDAKGENAGKVLVPYKGYLKQICEAGFTFPPIGEIGEGYFTPQYSKDVGSAMSVVRKVRLPMPAWELPSNPENILSLSYDYFKKHNP